MQRSPHDEGITWTGQEPLSRLIARRLRDNPLDAVRRVAGDIGPRPATSLTEAQTAAYFDGRLRRAGMSVGIDTFGAPVSDGWDATIIAVCMLGCIAFYPWLPLVSLGLALCCLIVSGWGVWRPYSPLLGKRSISQNVIGTRSNRQSPPWRVVLLAPLDSPRVVPPMLQAVAQGYRKPFGMLVASLALLCIVIVGMVVQQSAWWYVLLLPAAYVLVLVASDWIMMRMPASPGAVNHAGALAVLLSSVEALTHVDQVELWGVGLGATRSRAGIDDLLRRYPFEPERALFIGLEGIGSNTLTFLTRERLFREQAADQLLVDAALATDAADSRIDAEPRAYKGIPTIGGWLAYRGWRTLTITCRNPDNRAPHSASADDTPDVVENDILERAVRLVVGVVNHIDQAAIRSAEAPATPPALSLPQEQNSAH